MSIVVQLERFEGPLGLLLHLIREQEMDVFNINVNQITRQYLEYIKAMRRLDLEVAGEFVAMAATLIHLKSRMLLPQYNEEGEEVSEDPRKELVQKLVEYKKFQEVSGELYKRPLLGRDVLTRGEREKVEPVVESDIVLADNPLFSLISAYRFAVKNMKKGVHKVASELQSIASRILEMKDRLVIGQRVIFRELLNPNADAKGNHVLVTFLSLLELAKMGFVAVFQNEPLSDIHIEAKRAVDRDVVSNVEDYNSVNAAMVADEILSEAQLTLDEPTGEDDDHTREGEEPTHGREAFTDAASDADIEAEEKRLFAEEGIHLVEFDPVESVDESERAEAGSANAEPVAHHHADLHLATPDDAAPQDALDATSSDAEHAAPPESRALSEESTAAAAVESSELRVAAEADEEASLNLSSGDAPTPEQPDSEALSAENAATADVVDETSSMELSSEEDAPVVETQSEAEAIATAIESSTDLQASSTTSSAAELGLDPAEEPAPETLEAVTEANAEAKEASETDLQKKNVDSALAAALSAFDAFDEPADEGEKKDRPPEVES